MSLAADPTDQPPPPTAATILVVDDRPQSRRQIRLQLGAKGYRTVEAEDGIDGWAAFIEHKPDAVVTDMRMPRADGMELLERIRNEADIPIFCITAYPDLDSGLLAMKRGAEYYYRWPQELERMIDEIEVALSQPRRQSKASAETSATSTEAAAPEISLKEIRAAGKSLTIEERKVAIRMALADTRGNVEKAAQLLGISRRSFYHWMDRYGVDRSG